MNLLHLVLDNPARGLDLFLALFPVREIAGLLELNADNSLKVRWQFILIDATEEKTSIPPDEAAGVGIDPERSFMQIPTAKSLRQQGTVLYPIEVYTRRR